MLKPLNGKDKSLSETKFLTTKQAAEMTGFSVYWFERKRWTGNGIPFIKIGRSVRYKYLDILSFMEKHPTITSTSSNGGENA
jgi:hypothetical protein